MLKHYGGGRVKAGFYWDLAKWTIVTIPREGGPLPGGAERDYLRIPLVLLLLLAPAMGGLYVLFLPFIGFAMLLQAAGTEVAKALGRALVGIMATVSPAWRPGEAYFAGKEPPAPSEARGGEGEGEKAE